MSSVASYDGERTLMLSVRKQSGTNTVAVVDQVMKRLVEVKKTLPNRPKVATGLRCMTRRFPTAS